MYLDLNHFDFIKSHKLLSALNWFNCKKRNCPYYGVGRQHPFGARGNGRHYNSAAIPQPLAEEVADYVHAELLEARIRYKESPVMTEEEKLEFNKAMAATEEEAEMMESAKVSRVATAVSSSGASDTPMEEATTDEATDTDW